MSTFRTVVAAAAAALALAAPAQASSLRAEHLRTGYMTDPVGIDDRAPTLSWELRSQTPGAEQRAYQVRVIEQHGEVRGGRVLLPGVRIAKKS